MAMVSRALRCCGPSMTQNSAAVINSGTTILIRLLRPVFAAVALLAQHADGQRPHEPSALIGMTPDPSPQYDVPPKLLSGRVPIYPITRLQRGESGNALIGFTIDEHGIPRDFRIIQSDYPYYASHAIVAMREWRFQPAIKNGKPVAARARIPFHYRIR